MQTLRENFLGTPLTLFIIVQHLTHPLQIPNFFSRTSIGNTKSRTGVGWRDWKAFTVKRNYEQNLAEMTPEFWRVSD